MRTDLRVRERTSTTKSEAGFTDSLAADEDRRKFFGDLARFLWVIKPEVALHQRTGATERMCRWWLDGTHPPNARAVRALLGEILRRL
jgi:hypothetical protein